MDEIDVKVPRADGDREPSKDDVPEATAVKPKLPRVAAGLKAGPNRRKFDHIGN